MHHSVPLPSSTTTTQYLVPTTTIYSACIVLSYHQPAPSSSSPTLPNITITSNLYPYRLVLYHSPNTRICNTHLYHPTSDTVNIMPLWPVCYYHSAPSPPYDTILTTPSPPSNVTIKPLYLSLQPISSLSSQVGTISYYLHSSPTTAKQLLCTPTKK